MENIEIPQEIRSFLESILADANMTLDDVTKEEMIKELYARLDSYLTTVIVDNMPAEHLEAFMKLNEEKKPREEIDKFLKEKMPNAEEVFTNAFADFRQLYLNNVTVARNTPSQGNS